MTVIDVAAIRAAFPALERRVDGHPVAFFDGPGGTQVPRAVADAMTEYLLHHNANTHWNYPTSIESDALLAAARDTFATFFNGAAEEVSFGNNMTTITFHVARALARSWQPGDEVIITEIDHHGNVAPWQAIARDRGIVLRSLPLDPQTFQLDLSRLASLLSPRTRLLAINAASNLLGTVSDVAAAARMARDAGALVYVDGVHYAPHLLPDVRVLGCDFFACSAYKFHGPHIGVLWSRAAVQEALDVPKLEPAPATGPERLETGTQNHEGIVGGAAAVRWLASLASDTTPLRAALVESYRVLHEREGALFQQLWDALGEVKGVTRYGPPPSAPRTATLSCTIAGHASEQVAGALSRDGLFVSHGDFYASTIAERLGQAADGFVRIGAACYTDTSEIERLVGAISRLVA